MPTLESSAKSGLQRTFTLAEDVAHVAEAGFGLVAELFTKTTAILIAIILIGILLLAARDVLYTATAWSSTQLTVAVVAWDAWLRTAAPPTQRRSALMRAAG